jgi:predicted small integral membrane protein
MIPSAFILVLIAVFWAGMIAEDAVHPPRDSTSVILSAEEGTTREDRVYL